jgi:hypothetical protein
MSQFAFAFVDMQAPAQSDIFDPEEYMTAKKWYKKFRSLCIDKHSRTYPRHRPDGLMDGSVLVRWGPGLDAPNNSNCIIFTFEDEELIRKSPKNVQISLYWSNYNGKFNVTSPSQDSRVVQDSQKAQSLGMNGEGKDYVPVSLVFLLEVMHETVKNRIRKDATSTLPKRLPDFVFMDLRVNDIVLYRTFRKFFQDNNIDIDVRGDNCKSERKEKVLSPTYVFCAGCYVLDPQNKCCAKCKVSRANPYSIA